MDPLSIAAGAASLAGTVTSISIFLYNLIQEVKGIDAKVVDLSKEVSRLKSLLSSVEETVRQCQKVSLTLAHLDDHMWLQIENALVDCRVTVQELDLITIKIGGEHNKEINNVSRLLRKPSLHFRFAVHGDEVSDLTQKVYKSNCAMQTALAVVNVSLTFRTHVSQESLFTELRNLKKLVEESLKAATQQQAEANGDPFSARQSRNLESLAKAAQKFHAVASSTASTRYSIQGDRLSVLNWGGSEAGSLTPAQRERIEVWNDLSTVEEGPEDGSTTENSHSIPTDNSTTITVPDMDDVLCEVSKGKGPELAVEEHATDSDDESDVELDFLRNFEKLAYSSFLAQDYSKAEQCLRMAIERSTGETSSTADSSSLKAKLALCCCLQEKWDHAAGIVASLPKTRSAANIPTFHLLQAISLAHLQENRLEDAYSVCKTALQGKKKTLGRTSADYYGCLTVFAAICDKKGDTLEAEAIRHSIPRDWFPPSSVAVLSPKQYILRHESLIDSIFAKKPGAEPAWSYPGSPTSPDPSETTTGDPSVQWAALGPSIQRDRVQGAQQDRKTGTVVGETDTGKEFCFADDFDAFTAPSAPALRDRVLPPTNPWAQHVVTNTASPVARKALPNPFDPPDLEQAIFKPTEVQQAANSPISRPPAPIYPLTVPSHIASTPIPPNPHGTPQISLDTASTEPARTPLALFEPGSSNLPSTARSRTHMTARASSLRQPRPTDIFGITNSVSQLNLNLKPTHEANPSIQVHPPPPPYFSNDTRQPSINSASQPHPIVSSNLGRSRSHADRLERSPSSPNRPRGHQTLIDKVEQAKRQHGHRPSRSEDNVGRPASPERQVFIEQMDASQNEEYFSTLEVVPRCEPGPYASTSSNSMSSSAYATPATPTGGYPGQIQKRVVLLNHASLSTRVRWNVQKDISNMGGPRPFGPSALPQFLPTRSVAGVSDTDSLWLGVALRHCAVDTFAFGKGTDDITVCGFLSPFWQGQPQDANSTSASSSSSGMFGMRKLIRRMKSNVGKGRGTSEFTVNMSNPRLWSRGPLQLSTPASLFPTDLFTYPDSLVTSELRLIELAIAEQIQQAHATATTASVRVGGVVCTVPDLLADPLHWPTMSGFLGDCSLLQHSKVIPHSFAVMQYFLDTGELVLPPPHPDNPISHHVLVLNCDDWIVECTSYVLQVVSPDLVEVVESDPSYMAEVASLTHVQSAFSQLIDQRVKLMNDQLRQKMDQDATASIVESCARQFSENILPNFDNDGRSWTVDYEMPSHFAARHGRFEINNGEILECFSPSRTMIRKMVKCTVNRTREPGDLSAWHLLLAGSYAKSRFLRGEINRAALQASRTYNIQPPTLLHSTEAENIVALGALSHARGC